MEITTEERSRRKEKDLLTLEKRRRQKEEELKEVAIKYLAKDEYIQAALYVGWQNLPIEYARLAADQAMQGDKGWGDNWDKYRIAHEVYVHLGLAEQAKQAKNKLCWRKDRIVCTLMCSLFALTLPILYNLIFIVGGKPQDGVAVIVGLPASLLVCFFLLAGSMLVAGIAHSRMAFGQGQPDDKIRGRGSIYQILTGFITVPTCMGFVALIDQVLPLFR